MWKSRIDNFIFCIQDKVKQTCEAGTLSSEKRLSYQSWVISYGIGFLDGIPSKNYLKARDYWKNKEEILLTYIENYPQK